MQRVEAKYKIKAASTGSVTLTHSSGARLSINGELLGYCRKSGFPIVRNEKRAQVFPNFFVGEGPGVEAYEYVFASTLNEVTAKYRIQSS